MQTVHSETLLLTGSGGKLGQLLAASWASLPPTVKIRYLSGSIKKDFCWVPGQSTAELPQCDTIVSLWGRTIGSREELAANSDLALISHQIALACKASRIFHFSSSAVYGPGKNLTETAPLVPVNEYGASKRDMEETVSKLSDDGITHCCLRLANVVGADSLAPALQSKSPLILDQFHDRTGPLRSYIGAGMLGRIIIGLSQLPGKELPKVINVAASNAISMESLARAAGIPFQWRPAPPHAVPEVSLDVSRLSKLLPKMDLNTNARELIDEWKRLEKLK